jgi:hypothetical protein
MPKKTRCVVEWGKVEKIRGNKQGTEEEGEGKVWRGQD